MMWRMILGGCVSMEIINIAAAHITTPDPDVLGKAVPCPTQTESWVSTKENGNGFSFSAFWKDTSVKKKKQIKVHLQESWSKTDQIQRIFLPLNLYYRILLQIVTQNVSSLFRAVFGNSPHYLSLSAAAFSGNNETGHDLSGCMGGRPISIISGKGLRKKSWKTHCNVRHNSEGKCVVLDLASRVLHNQVMSMVTGKDSQFFTIVKLDPLVASFS